MNFNESIVKINSLTWFGELGYFSLLKIKRSKLVRAFVEPLERIEKPWYRLHLIRIRYRLRLDSLYRFLGVFAAKVKQLDSEHYGKTNEVSK